MVPSYLVSSISSVHADAGVANTQQRQAKSIHSQRCNTLISMSLTLVVGASLISSRTCVGALFYFTLYGIRELRDKGDSVLTVINYKSRKEPFHIHHTV